MSDRQRILSEPAITPAAVRYHVISISLAAVISVIGIPLLPVIVPFALLYYRRYFAHLKVVLTARDLQIDRGIWMREEKRIPLEKITDLTTFQGPVMRRMGLRGLRVETAGQAGGTGNALVRIVGLENTEAFRELVLSQRDRIAEREGNEKIADGTTTADTGGVEERLTEIRDCLLRMEKRLQK